jgi:hypothetical protein
VAKLLATKVKPWEYEKEMSFLIPLFHDRATLSNLIFCDEENGESSDAAGEISELKIASKRKTN